MLCVVPPCPLPTSRFYKHIWLMSIDHMITVRCLVCLWTKKGRTAHPKLNHLKLLVSFPCYLVKTSHHYEPPLLICWKKPAKGNPNEHRSEPICLILDFLKIYSNHEDSFNIKNFTFTWILPNRSRLKDGENALPEQGIFSTAVIMLSKARTLHQVQTRRRTNACKNCS